MFTEVMLLDLEFIMLLVGFGIVAVASGQLSKLFQWIHLPLISGMIFIGIISGPYIVNLIPANSIGRLSFINDLSLAFIAFAAGSELYLNELRNRFNSIRWLTLGQLIISFLLGALLVFLISENVPYMKDLSLIVKACIAFLTGAVFVASSPALAIGIIKELRAKGPLAQTVLGVTVVKDFLIVILFGVILSISETLINGNEFSMLAIVLIMVELILSFAMGYLLYQILRFIISLKFEQKVKSILVLLAGFSVYQFSYLVRHGTEQVFQHEIFLEPLLICITGSFIITNYSKHRAEFIRIISDIGTPIYIMFFTLVGAGMRLDVLAQSWLVTLSFFFIRVITIVIGAYIGGTMAKDPASYNRIAWMPYMPQAGVALGLTTIVAGTFPDWGPQFSAVIISVIVLNQFVGPPLFKWAIRKVGEDRSRGNQYEFDGIKDVLIFGLESQSIALAKQLSHKGWLARIITLDADKKDTRIEGVEVIYLEGISLEKLNQVHADRTEVFVTLLTDKQNLEICEIAYQAYGTKVMVVRLTDRENFETFHKLGALIVEPATAMVSLLDHFVRSPQATSLLLGMQKDQDSRDIEVLNPNLHGIFLRDLRLPAEVIVLSIKRSGQVIISHGYTRLRMGDVLTLVGSIESLDNVTLRFEG